MIEEIKKKLKSISLIEAIVSPDWEDRYYSYNSKWGTNIEMASMRNGSGDEWFLWINNDYVAFKLLDHESGLLDDIDSIKNKFPPEFLQFVEEPAFSINQSTSLWYLRNSNWNKFDKNELIAKEYADVFNWTPENYKNWADEYYDIDINIVAIENIMSGKISNEEIQLINTDLEYNDLKDEIEEIGINR